LLYGQSLALNHLIETGLNVIKLEDNLDYPSYYDNSVFKVLHIHVFHGDSMFSKFQFKLGAYDKMVYNSSQIHLVKYYALKMALDAKRTSYKQLVKLLNNETNKKN
jgi:hypothetical protein